jgi:hypothetical protein
MMVERTEHWWNDNMGKLKYFEKILPSATLSTTVAIWTVLGLKPGLHDKQPHYVVLLLHKQAGTYFWGISLVRSKCRF